MRSLTSRSSLATGLIVVSLALGASGAMGADLHAKPSAKPPVSRGHAAVHIAARHRYPVPGYAAPWPQANAAQIIGSLLGSPWLKPYIAHYSRGVPATHQSQGTYVPYDPPTSDTSPPPDNSIQDMLNAQLQQQADDQVNAINQMNATMAADAAQAAADNAALNQQIMNNGGL